MLQTRRNGMEKWRVMSPLTQLDTAYQTDFFLCFSHQYYKDYFYYACKHRKQVDGHVCTYKKQWGEDKINDAVAEVIKKLVQNPKFEAAIRERIDARIDTGELDQEIENLRKQLRQVIGAKNKLAQQMDNLDIMDSHYDRKYQDMQERMERLYDQIDSIEESIAEVDARIHSIRQQKI